MGVEESISALVESAKAERDSIIEEIEYMLNYRFAELLQDSQAIVKSFNNIKEMLGLEINLENTMLDFLDKNSTNLRTVSKKLSKIEISEENLIDEVEDFIGNAQNLLEKMELAIKEAKTNLLRSLENQITMANQLNGKNGIAVEEVEIVEELKIIDEDQKVEIDIEEIQVEHKKGQGITVEDVEDEKEKIQGIVVEDVKNTEDSVVAGNDIKKSFSERIKARIKGKNSTVLNNRNNTEKEENIK